MQRLQKIIAQRGYCSRRKAEQLIIDGKVSVNGSVIDTLGISFPSDVEIKIDGEILKDLEEKEYYLLNKPRNYLSTVKDDRGRPIVVDLIKTKSRIYPVGRLDFEVTGALLLTNDGDLTNKLIHPRFEVEKVYIATIKGRINIKTFHKLIDGVFYEQELLKASFVEHIKYNLEQNYSIVKIGLKEGRNHQVKNMIQALGYVLLKLNRESFAGINTKGLREGQYRQLTNQEINYLKSLNREK